MRRIGRTKPGARGRLWIFRDATDQTIASPDDTVLSFQELRRLLSPFELWRNLLAYDEVRLVCHRYELLTRPLLSVIALCLLGRKRFIQDEQGVCLRIGLRQIASLCARFVRDRCTQRATVRRIKREIRAMRGSLADCSESPRLNLQNTPLYLRTDLSFGIRSGGSVGHIAGVVNNLHHFGAAPVFCSTATIPTISADIENHIVRPGSSFWDFPSVRSMAFSEECRRQLHQTCTGMATSFVYHRYRMFGYSGARLAADLGVPFVLEYNGSEVWIQKNWGPRGIPHEALAEEIELLNLHAADLVVVVSRPLRDELVERGIDPAKILINPNGVDPERYSPTVSGMPVRERYGLNDKTVVGFIGTFGLWHGAEVLAEAFGKLLRVRPSLRDHVRLLMIGDGVTRNQVRQTLTDYDVLDLATLTGLVAQEDGPAHLAACDIFASPHVPNQDGSPFFGSPTKLFEYMAMGRPIVASDLEQIGEILEHGRTGWLVQPGDCDDLAAGLKLLIKEPEIRSILAEEARSEVVANYTWKEHTRRIIEALSKRCAVHQGSAPAPSTGKRHDAAA